MAAADEAVRGRPGLLSWFLMILPGILLGVGCHLFLLGAFVDLTSPDMSWVAVSVASAIPGLISRMGKIEGTADWLGLCAIMTVVIVAGSLTASAVAVLFLPFFMSFDSPHLAGIILGLPGCAVALLILWAIHRAAGNSSPWAWLAVEP